MRATAEIITRWFPIVILSVFGWSAGGSNGADDPSSTAGNIQSGNVEEVTTQREAKEGAEGKVRAGSTGDREVAGQPAEMVGPKTEKSSLVYTRDYYSYNVRKKRDPFLPLLTRGGQLKGLTLNELSLTGILWGEDRTIAVMENSQGRGFLLQVGDTVAGARLVAIREDAAVFRVVEFGVIHNIEKKLFIEEEKPL
jgi:hypothetical protein